MVALVAMTPATAGTCRASPYTGNARRRVPPAPTATRGTSLNDTRRVRNVRLASHDRIGDARVFLGACRRLGPASKTRARDVRRDVGGVLGGDDDKNNNSDNENPDPEEPTDLTVAEDGTNAPTARQRIRYALKRIDSDGYWAVISSGIVFGTFLLESYNMSSFGGWDVLYRDDISWYTGLISMNALEDIEDAYNLLFFFEFCLRAWAFEFKKDFWTNPVTAVDFLATIPPILSFFDIVYRGSPVFRFLRLLRVLRLLRLLDRSPDSVLFGLVRSDSMSIQLVGIGFEFVCIFIIAAGVIYDLEYTVNPNVNNLNDTLYWAILTLTGIGQPFEVVTAGGRVATVLSIAVALIVVPGQLAKLATVASTQDMMRRYDEEMGEDDSYDENEPLRSGDFEEVGARRQMAFQGGGIGTPFGAFVPPIQINQLPPARKIPSKRTGENPNAAGIRGASEPALETPLETLRVVAEDGADLAILDAQSQTVAMRGKVWDGRECDTCGLQIHETDARFCRRCGDKLGMAVGALYVKRETAGDTVSGGRRKAKKTRALLMPNPGKTTQGVTMQGRIGLDITGATMSNFRDVNQQGNNRGGGGKKRPGSKKNKS